MRLHFPLLSNTNYLEWSMQMKAELIEKGLWKQVYMEVDGTGKTSEEIVDKQTELAAKQTVKKRAETWAKMIQWVETLQLVHPHEWNSMVIWEKLVVVHRAQGLATQLAK